MSGNDNTSHGVQNEPAADDGEILGDSAKPPEVLDTFDVARFWSRVEVRRRDQCWPWRYGALDGYGIYRYANGAREDAHRVAYRILHGAIPPRAVIRHQCDNGVCSNPWHMVKGSQADNVQDRVDRGRSARGEEGGRALLTERQVRALRASPLSDEYWAGRLGVDRRTIRAARDGETWAHVEDGASERVPGS